MRVLAMQSSPQIADTLIQESLNFYYYNYYYGLRVNFPFSSIHPIQSHNS